MRLGPDANQGGVTGVYGTQIINKTDKEAECVGSADNAHTSAESVSREGSRDKRRC